MEKRVVFLRNVVKMEHKKVNFTLRWDKAEEARLALRRVLQVQSKLGFNYLTTAAIQRLVSTMDEQMEAHKAIPGNDRDTEEVVEAQYPDRPFIWHIKYKLARFLRQLGHALENPNDTVFKSHIRGMTYAEQKEKTAKWAKR